METVKTVWEIITYDVWGNEKEGFEVNNAFKVDSTYEMDIPVTVHNKGTEREFKAASPTDNQLRKALDLRPRIRIDTDGDDLTIYVNHTPTGYPCGELRCVSHESLSPIR